MAAPLQSLKEHAAKAGVELASAAFAKYMDAQDKLAHLRDEFHIPTLGSLSADAPAGRENEPCVYLCGNSLGLQPKGTRKLLEEELEVWSTRGVNGHFDHQYNRPWVAIDETVQKQSARIVGALPNEVATMNTLTGNLHLLMAAFYTPTKDRYKIVFEDKAFPSDHYAFESQARLHGYDPADALILLKPRAGEYTLRTEDIVATIEQNAASIAVVCLSGVQYYTGQFFDIPAITEAGQKAGAIVGFDLAHAVGNVPLRLHDWGVDFACWCSYKYLNSGPGGIAGAFVHERHATDFTRVRLAGWWGHDKVTRFKMNNEFVPMAGASGFQLSNPSVLTTVALLGSLNVFEKTSMEELRAKSLLLTGFLEYLLKDVVLPTMPGAFEIITPSDPAQRGSQLSVLFARNVVSIHDKMEKLGLICDKREPNVLRFAPAALYNSFTDVWEAAQRITAALKDD